MLRKELGKVSLEYSVAVFIVAFASENLAKVIHSVMTMGNQAQDMTIIIIISGIKDKELKCAEPCTGIRHFSQFITEAMWI